MMMIIIMIMKTITQFVFYSCHRPLGNVDWAIPTNGRPSVTLTYECYIYTITTITIIIIIIIIIIATFALASLVASASAAIAL